MTKAKLCELAGASELGRYWSSEFGVSLTLCVEDVALVVGCFAGQAGVPVPHGGPESSTIVGGVEPCAVDTQCEPGVGECESELVVVAAGLVLEAGDDDGSLAPAQREKLLANFGRLSHGCGVESFDRCDCSGLAVDDLAGMADGSLLVADRCLVGAFGPFEAHDGAGDGGKFDVAAVAGCECGDLRVLLGGGFHGVVAQVACQLVGV